MDMYDVYELISEIAVFMMPAYMVLEAVILIKLLKINKKLDKTTGELLKQVKKLRKETKKQEETEEK